MRYFLAGIIAFAVMLLTFVSLNYLGINPFSQKPISTITVTGIADQKVTNKIARFSVTVSYTLDNKEDVLNKVNRKIADIIAAVEAFGVSKDDIKTQNANFYQMTESYYDKDGRRKTRPGQWQASNTIEITFRQPDKSEDLIKVLNKTGATSVYGPTFTTDKKDVNQSDQTLLLEAIKNAKDKANQIAKKNNLKVTRILNISESGVNYSFPEIRATGTGGGGPYNPGQSSQSKTVTVTFEVK